MVLTRANIGQFPVSLLHRVSRPQPFIPFGFITLVYSIIKLRREEITAACQKSTNQNKTQKCTYSLIFPLNPLWLNSSDKSSRFNCRI